MLGCIWEINLSLKIGISVTTKQIEWVLFYESMANKVRYYRDKRKSLLEDIRSLQANVKEGRLLKYIHDKRNDIEIPLEDICPFTLLSTFNRDLKDRFAVGAIYKFHRL